MKIVSSIFVAGLMGLAGCSTSHPARTHRGDLLDEKVAAQRVQAALKSAGTEYAHVRADATNGVVVLSGVAASPQIRSQAEKVARGVHELKELQNQIQVEQ